MSHPECFLFICLWAIGCLERHSAQFVYSSTTRGISFVLMTSVKPLISWTFSFVQRKWHLPHRYTEWIQFCDHTDAHSPYFLPPPPRSTVTLTRSNCSDRGWKKTLLFLQINFTGGCTLGSCSESTQTTCLRVCTWKQRGSGMAVERLAAWLPRLQHCVWFYDDWLTFILVVEGNRAEMLTESNFFT